ncbi:SNF2-related protein [Oribacterium sp. oral taxon 078]|uniref:SNF2-related protein n=1 Tax=Oribacterium sp. oral taxon 078 TaxID=652706 RepID=UPI0001BCC0D6|nr:SNF2-related protein [Oribacterium sp. oral taxon 078]
MDTSYIISKMNEYMFRLNQQIGGWLEKKLPKITDDWWQDLVFNNLSPLQRETVLRNDIHEIKGLDLAALLRVLDRNWFVITSTFFINNKERGNIRTMQEIRNTWAHITPNDISKAKVIDDVNVIIALMQAFDASMKDTRDMENFIFDVEEDKDIHATPAKEPVKEAAPAAESPASVGQPEGIAVGSIVVLVSDPSVIGAVIGVSGNKYSVLVNGKVQSYYKEQIQLQNAKEEHKYLSLPKVRSALTAYQIHNPGSSNLYSLNSARIDFVPYQFRPALRMIQADSPRVLVADDVGVGKTIEAGLILKELEARSSLTSVLVICPRPLVAERKWQLEMKRFDEDFTQLDGRMLAECISETDRDGEWPERHSKTIIPYSLFGEDSIMGRGSRSGKKHKDIGLSELDPLPHFDLVIVDEAHNIRNANTWAYRGVELFCRNADAVVFLTATPLQNSNNDLYTLLNLLRPDVIIDKDTFKTMSEPNAFINNLLRIVRNQEEGWQEAGKAEIANILSTTWGRNVIQHNPEFEKIFTFLDRTEVTRDERIEMIGKIEGLHSFHTMINRTRRKDIEDFCIRRTQTVEVPFNGVQRDLYDALIEFESTALAQLHGSRSVRFMMCTIMRQAASCIYGLAPFMNDIVKRRLSQIQEDGELYEYDFELNSDEENSLFELADEIDKLSGDLPKDDPKFDRMLEVIQEKQTTDNNRVIIFSSFRHTLSYLREKLTAQGIRVGQVDGSVPDEERYKLRQRFLLDRDNVNAVDVLFFSEVGCEGLDYQFCDTMINYDLPWNPMRIEQRIGRIDRRGQKSDTVKIYNMITQGTIDAVIYDRCLSKIGVFEASIGDCSEILGDISDQIFKIMFDPELTDEERQMKIEQMADNEVMKVQELHRLEQEEKSLYGFDLSKYMMDKDVQDAENAWINPQSLNELLNIFMDDYLGQGEYLRGKQDGKTLRLAADKRQLLLDDLMKMPLSTNNHATKLWKAYLKSDKPVLSVTFESQYAKDNRDVTFFTQMHPFVAQAAAYESRNFPCDLAVRIADPEVEPGDYEFLIYAWRYVGLRPDIRLVAVSSNPAVEKNILNFIQYASEYYEDDGTHQSSWDQMDDLHYKRWQDSKEQYSADVRDECEYRKEQLAHSFHQQEAIVRGQVESATDDKIKRMRIAQLENITKKYNAQTKKVDETVAKVDIHTNLLVRGVLHVD